MPTIEQELEFFGTVKDSLVEHHEGKYVVIHDSTVVSVWDTQESAYLDGITRFGNVPFLIKRILKTEQAEEIPLLFLGR